MRKLLIDPTKINRHILFILVVYVSSYTIAIYANSVTQPFITNLPGSNTVTQQLTLRRACISDSLKQKQVKIGKCGAILLVRSLDTKDFWFLLHQ